MKADLRALTGARGVAAWLVVAFHLRHGIAGLPRAAMAALDKGYLAVDFFFLLSGFVLWLNYADVLRARGLAGAPGFLWRRMARIWPLHLAMLGFALALMLLLAATGRQDTLRFPLGELPLHLFLVQSWGLTDHLAWNDPAWSISAELAAYLMFPALVITIDWRRVPGWALIAAAVALAQLLMGFMAASGATILGDDIAHLGVVRCMVEFTIGTMVCALWQRLTPRRDAAPLAFLAAAGFALAWALGASEMIAVPLGFAALLLGLALGAGARGNVLEGRALHYLGRISYATYLLHFLLFYAFKLALVHDAGAVPPALIGLYLLLVLLGSVGLHHLVELPAQRWLNRRRTRIRPLALS